MSKNTHGLAPFDDPVYLEAAGEDPEHEIAPAERTSRPVIAFLSRGSVVAVLAALLPFLTTDDIRWSLAVLVSLHLPITTVLDLLRVGAERAKPLLSCFITALDATVLLVLALLAGRATVMGTVGLLMIAFHRWLYGRRPAALSVVVTTIGLAILVQQDRLDADWIAAASIATVGALLVWLVDDQATRHTAATRGLHLVATRAEAVLEGIGDAIVSTDGQGRLRGVNPAAVELLGGSPDDMHGRHCSTVLALHGDGGPLDCSDRCGLLALGDRAVEVQRRGERGNRQPLLASAVALRDEDGNPLEVVHLLRDITTIKQAEEAKTLFLATASHELKTPLSVIRGYAQLLTMDGVRDEDRRQAVTSIEQRSRELVGIVDRLLMSSRIDTGQVELRPRLRPVEPVIEERCVGFANTHRPVDLHVPADLPRALSDDAALATVLDHLLENAHKYSPAGGAIRVEASSDDDHVAIAVRDTGIGMSPAQMRQCFDRFWQAEGTDVRRFGGTGIGLYIVASLVQSLGGAVTVAANDGPGVTFTIHLRRRPVDDEQTDDGPPAGAEAGEGEESMIREFMRQMGVLSGGAA